MCVYTYGSPIGIKITDALEQDRRQHDRTAACVIAPQQYYFAVFVSLHFHSRKDKFFAPF
jgi:hypothetical protein